MIWLKQHNPLYKNITIEMSGINLLPDDDFISVAVTTVDAGTDTYDEGACNEKNLKDQLESTSF